MARSPLRIAFFLAELKRRRVLHVAGGYAVVAWGAIEVAETTFPYLGFAEWAVTLVIAIAALGLPPILLLAWIYELTPEGLKRDEPELAPAGAATSLRAAPAAHRRDARVWAATFLAAGCFVLLGFAVGNLSQGAARASEGASALQSLAVLPLRDLSADTSDDFFADGMTEALIAELGRIGVSRVISHTSTMNYRNADRLLPEIAAELGVDGIVEGSVIREGNRVRISVRLVEAAAERHLWSDQYDRDLRDILALQSDVARDIAQRVRLALTPAQEEQLDQAALAASTDTAAYLAYLKGRYHYARFGDPDFDKAIGHYQRAITLEPDFALAHFGLAEVCRMRWAGDPSRRGECRAPATRALELAPGLAEANVVVADARADVWDWQPAEAAFRRAIELNPSSLSARFGYMQLLRTLGRLDEARAQIRTAEALDPLSLLVKAAVSWPEINARRFDDALAQLDRVLELDPDFGVAHYNKALVYVYMGRGEEAIAAARLAPSRLGEDNLHSMFILASGLALAGDSAGARSILTELEARQASPVMLAQVLSRLGDRDGALDLLEESYRMRDAYLPGALSEPGFDSLRSDPRLQALERRVGIRP